MIRVDQLALLPDLSGEEEVERSAYGSDSGERRKFVTRKLEEEIPAVLAKYEFADFERSKFEIDLRDWFAANAA